MLELALCWSIAVCTLSTEDWVRTTYEYTESTFIHMIRHELNSTSNPITVSTESKLEEQVHNVTGSSSSSPPWSAKFTPSSETLWGMTAICTGGTLNPNKQWKWLVYYRHEDGVETWTRSNPTSQESRNRNWFEYLDFQRVESDITSGGGSGEGG